jgi:DNA processing protein
MEERIAIIALSRLKGINSIQKRTVVDTFDNIASLFEKNATCFGTDLCGIASSFTGWKKIESDLKKLDAIGAGVVTIRDKEYPQLLKNTPDAPLVLYKKGALEIETNTLAIVGSRKATVEGMNLAEKCGESLSSVGISVVSGLARGIDTSAHRGALKEKGGTIAVLGCGIDVCYPPENRRLYDRIGEEGLLLSEYTLGERPLAYHFPERNRIIAGLSKGVLVVEASKKSGSLITARLGLEYGREVMAVPGSVFREEYQGGNTLIKQGAKLVDNIDDIIITCFPGYTLKQKEPVKIEDDEEKVFSVIRFEKIHIDEIIEKSGMEPKGVMAILTKLEMKDIIREAAGGFYIRK